MLQNRIRPIVVKIPEVSAVRGWDGCRCNERLNAKTEGSKLLAHVHCVARVEINSNNSKTISGCSGHAGGTGPGQTRKKPMDLSVREREERGRGEGGGVYAVCM